MNKYTFKKYLFFTLALTFSSYCLANSPTSALEEDLCAVDRSDPYKVLNFFITSEWELNDVAAYIGWCAIAQFKNGDLVRNHSSVNPIGGGSGDVGDSFSISEIYRTKNKARYKLTYTPFATPQQVNTAKFEKYVRYSGPEKTIEYTLILYQNKWYVVNPRDYFLHKKSAVLQWTNRLLTTTKPLDESTLKVLLHNKQLLKENN